MSELIKACQAVIEARGRRENGRLQQMDFDLLAYDHASQIAKACLILRKGILQELKNIGECSCGHETQVGEGYGDGMCSLHAALSEADSLINKGGEG